MIPLVSRSTTLALVAASLLGTTTALADDAPPTPAGGEEPRPVPSQEAPHTYRLLAEPVVTVPLGAFAQVTGPGVGALIGGDYRLSDAWRLTARAGYVQGSETSIPVAGLSLKSSVSYAPVLAGARVVVLAGDLAHADTSTVATVSLGFRFASF